LGITIFESVASIGGLQHGEQIVEVDYGERGHRERNAGSHLRVRSSSILSWNETRLAHFLQFGPLELTARYFFDLREALAQSYLGTESSQSLKNPNA
jgi:hypothetical protein